MKYQVIIKNDEYYTDWIRGEDAAIDEINSYVSNNDGEFDDYTYREMTWEDVQQHYPGQYTVSNWNDGINQQNYHIT